MIDLTHTIDTVAVTLTVDSWIQDVDRIIGDNSCHVTDLSTMTTER
jgi:hypothetical protein